MNTTLIPDVTLTFHRNAVKNTQEWPSMETIFFLTVPSELKICKFSLDFYTLLPSLIPAGPIYFHQL